VCWGVWLHFSCFLPGGPLPTGPWLLLNCRCTVPRLQFLDGIRCRSACPVAFEEGRRQLGVARFVLIGMGDRKRETL
jgi:hypothetical protein